MCPLVRNIVPISPFINISQLLAFLFSLGRLAFIFILNPPQVIHGYTGFHVGATVTLPQSYIESFGQSSLIVFIDLVLFTMPSDPD